MNKIWKKLLCMTMSAAMVLGMAGLRRQQKRCPR